MLKQTLNTALSNPLSAIHNISESLGRAYLYYRIPKCDDEELIEEDLGVIEDDMPEADVVTTYSPDRITIEQNGQKVSYKKECIEEQTTQKLTPPKCPPPPPPPSSTKKTQKSKLDPFEDLFTFCAIK